ncbi:MAG: hypothetical protein P4M11_00045 [Candidatus Pacebacteria bacterium]|nr:hypothetical protein [Candidatus Paceibacterota bacterium]
METNSQNMSGELSINPFKSDTQSIEERWKSQFLAAYDGES